MPVITLTDLTIRNLKPPERGASFHLDRNLKGFGVKVTDKGAKSYVLTYGKKRKRIKLGDVGIVKLADAREQAKTFLAEYQLHGEQSRSMTFAKARDTFLDVHVRQNNRPGTAKEMERLLRRHFKAFEPRPLEEIETQEVATLIDGMLKTPSEANHAFAILKTFFRWCEKRGYIKNNPLRSLTAPVKTATRDRTLTDDEIASVLTTAPNQGIYGKIMLCLLLSGQRLHQITHFKGEFVDRTERTITWPPAIMKSNREHVIPLGEWMAQLIPNHDGFAFAENEKPFANWTKAHHRFLEAVEVDHFTRHDLRRTFATVHAKIGTPPHIVERLLAHHSGQISGVSAIYNRHSYLPEMRDALETYEAYLAKLTEPEA